MINVFFDKVFYMNLSDREDRNTQIIEQLDSFGIEAERIEAVDGRVIVEGEQKIEITEKGLPTTYDALDDTVLKAFKIAKEEGLKNFLLFEDDAELSPDFNEVFNSCVEVKERTIMVDDIDNPFDRNDPMTGDKIGEGYPQIEGTEEYRDLPDNWDMLSLGLKNGEYNAPNVSGRIHKLRSFSLGTAWGFNESIYEAMIEALEKKDTPYDICISNLSINGLGKVWAYGIMKGIVTQRAGYSDNVGKEVERKAVS